MQRFDFSAQFFSEIALGTMRKSKLNRKRKPTERKIHRKWSKKSNLSSV